ncbi:hypothetical protein U14_04031 [Candidatus Moduliflexus flocculans]|uniref:STAS/SEC14 domain-containing protein n=1 Tax=Candidatus Moduliflexus flocculans TaxID=1499966 RepID=A0A0S6W4A0_9BACT|nr:hypothetical protein U14_04031 [Candidatus Moduliflexus flocculans]
MENVQFITYKNVELLVIDFTSTKSVAEFLNVIDEAKTIIASRPLNSLLTLTDVTNSYFDSDIISAMKEYAAHNKPYIKAGAVVGISGARKIIFNSVLFFSGRDNLKMFDTRNHAMEWLCAYK